MYRIGFILVMVLAITLGIVIGTLNPEIVHVDLLWFQLSWPLGLTLICVLILGAMIGLLLIGLFALWPMKLRLRKAERRLSSSELKNQALTPSSMGTPDV